MKKSLLFILALCLAIQALCAPGAALADGWICSFCGYGNNGNFCSNCGRAREAAEPTQAAGLSAVAGYSGCMGLDTAYVYANSYIRNTKNPSLWIPQNSADGNETTCWQFSSADNALGSVFIEYQFAAQNTVDELWFKNGFRRSTTGSDVYSMNARAKQVYAELCDVSGIVVRAVRFVLPDDHSGSGWQKVGVGRTDRVASVRLYVESTYAGSRYPNDVCMTEFLAVQNTAGFSYATIASAPASGVSAPEAHTSGNTQSAKLLMRLSTRSGPGTKYGETGTFYNGNNWKNATVKVLGKAWDKGNGIWWVLVDFDYGNAKYRLWTGLKRVDIDIDSVPEITSSGKGTIDPTETRRGPGSNYAKGTKVASKTSVTVYGKENGYVEVETYNESKKQYHRFWVPKNKVHIK